VAWLTCIETLFERFKHVRLLGADVTLVRFDLRNNDVVAVCQQGSRKAWVTLDSLEFPDLSPGGAALAAGVEAVLGHRRITQSAGASNMTLPPLTKLNVASSWICVFGAPAAKAKS